MATYVLYHSRCIDGFGAAWAAREYLGGRAEYHAAFYGGPLPEFEPESTIYMVDFCLKRPELVSLLAAGHDVIVLDHHKTAEADVAALEGAAGFESVFDMNKSGAVVTWEYFHAGKPLPKLLQWIQDRDIWKWEVEGTDAATEALMSYPFDFAIWDKLAADPDRLLNEGDALIRCREKVIEETLGRVYFSNVGGHKVPVVNSDSYISKLLNRMCTEYPDYPFAAGWNMRANGSRKWSLRSVGDFDVSAVAAKFGGGGHKNAAGFTTP